MKNIFKIITLFLLTISCKAQTKILPLYNNYNYGEVNGAYYKDINNFQNQFEGIWLYTNGSTSLKIVLTKKEKFHEVIDLRHYYEDYIVGDFQYIENGVEKINTLNNLLLNHSKIINYGLSGNSQMSKDIYPKCNECNPNEKRLNLDMNEPIVKEVVGLRAEMIARKFTENGIEKLKIWFIPKGTSYGVTYDDQPTNITKHTIPYGEYILVKQ